MDQQFLQKINDECKYKGQKFCNVWTSKDIRVDGLDFDSV